MTRYLVSTAITFPDVNLVLGPVAIGTVLNAFTYGICVAQFSTYWTSNPEDGRTIKILVGWTFFVDTFHTGALIYMLWVYVVDQFGNLIYLNTVLWPLSATPGITTLTSFPIEIYLAWRIRQFSGSTQVFFYLFGLAVVQTALGFICSIAAFMNPDIENYHRLIPFVDAWQVSAVLSEGSLTVFLWWYLSRSRTGLGRSDNVITRIIRSSVETAAFGAFFCIMDLITFTALQGTNFHVLFTFPLGRIYTNTLLISLNNRQLLREELQQPHMPEIALIRSLGHSACSSSNGPSGSSNGPSTSQ